MKSCDRVPGHFVIDDEGHTGKAYRDPWGEMKVKFDKSVGELKSMSLTANWNSVSKIGRENNMRANQKNSVLGKRCCKDRISEPLTSRISDLRRLWEASCKGVENVDLGNLFEYGLSFDYVAPNTFKDQRRGYFRWQRSWGGPSDEFRFYTDERLIPEHIDYWFLDWFDGAKTTLHGDREK